MPVSVRLNLHLISNRFYDDDVVVAGSGVGVVSSASHAQYDVYLLSLLLLGLHRANRN